MFAFKDIGKTFKRYFTLYTALYKDKRTPRVARIFLWMAIGYAMLPFDLIPDFIPIIGHIDDTIIIPVFIFIALRFIPSTLYKEHYKKIFQNTMPAPNK